MHLSAHRLIVTVTVVAGLLLAGPLAVHHLGAEEWRNVGGVVATGDDDDAACRATTTTTSTTTTTAKPRRSTTTTSTAPGRCPDAPEETPWSCIANRPLDAGVCIYDPLPNGLPW